MLSKGTNINVIQQVLGHTDAFVTKRFYADVTLTEGDMKFRLDGAWNTSFGSSTEGLLDSGDNIKVPAGNYRVYVNLNNSANQTYELNAEDYNK